jgi:hypothetical protein
MNPEKDKCITDCLGQLAERCFELGEPCTAASIMTLMGARMGGSGSIQEFAGLCHFWADEELKRMTKENPNLSQ